MIEFSWPFSQGEWFAWGFAVVTLVIGLGLLSMPRRMMAGFGLSLIEGTQNGLSETRAAGGFRFGLGLGAILLAQPLIYLTLGLGLALSVIGRVISFGFDRTFNKKTVFLTIFEGLGAFFMIGYGLTLIP